MGFTSERDDGDAVGALADVSLGDIVRALKRYRPVIVTVAVVIFVLTVVLPDPPPRAAKPAAVPFAPRTANAVRNPSSSPAAASASAPAVDAPAGASFTPSASAPTGFATATSPVRSGGNADFAAGDDGDGTTTREDFSFAAPTFVQPGQEQAAKAPLTVVARAWHTRSAGTPVASQGVPAGTLPVGTRATLTDKLSAVRLAGEADLLRLSEEPAGSRNTAGAVAVQMCQVTQGGWPEGEAKPMQEAPAHDATKCVNGSRSPDGVWTFDLSSFDTRTDDRGFVLVPGGGASPDFQVAFAVR